MAKARRKGFQGYETPDHIVQLGASLVGEPFTYDMAAKADGSDARAPIWSPDSLDRDWPRDGWCWVNPPYGLSSVFAGKMAREAESGSRICALMLASIGTEWFASSVFGRAAVYAIRPRFAFRGQTDPFNRDLMFIVYGQAPSFALVDWKTGEVRK